MGCAPVGKGSGSSASFSGDQGTNGGQGGSADVSRPQDPDPDQIEDDASAGWPGLKVCTSLDFSGVQWSSRVLPQDRDPFAVALDLTGGFEGPDGWANLTDNFDGQGFSMGLLNQNLGQGSLQPIWLDMRRLADDSMRSALGSDRYELSSSMLDRWAARTQTTGVLRLEDYGYNELDDLDKIAEDLQIDRMELEQTQAALLSHNQESVNWAVANVLTGTKLKSDWARALRTLAITPMYRTLQVQRAEKIHRSALGLMQTYNAWEWRSYLFFYDIVVQNGGISSTIRAQYFDWLKAHSNVGELARMVKLLELRLKVVNPKYVNDVRLRKMLTLTGHGVVHGKRYDLEKEYCMSLSAALRPQIPGT